MQGFKPASAASARFAGLGPVEAAFPNAVFPTGAIHEFVSAAAEEAAACQGFIGGLLHGLMLQGGVCLWISRGRNLFPASLKAFGVEPDRVIFIDVDRERDVLWVLEEALKCEGLAAVVGELRELNFMESRRLQLAVERSRVTGLIVRTDATKITTTACVARWQISPVASELEGGMPGLGLPRWQVHLLRVRNGNPGSWIMEWNAGEFKHIPDTTATEMLPEQRRKIG